MTPFLKPLPRYRCHKEVSALKIKAVIPNPRGYELHFENALFVPMQVSTEWMMKHLPSDHGYSHLCGGYAVWYEDGYMSWSPAAAFEGGYTPVDALAPTTDWSAWPGGPSEVEAALASRDAEIERLRGEVDRLDPRASHQEPLSVRLDPNAPCRNALARDGKSYPKSSCRRCGTLLRPGWKCAEGVELSKPPMRGCDLRDDAVEVFKP